MLVFLVVYCTLIRMFKNKKGETMKTLTNEEIKIVIKTLNTFNNNYNFPNKVEARRAKQGHQESIKSIDEKSNLEIKLNEIVNKLEKENQ